MTVIAQKQQQTDKEKPNIFNTHTYLLTYLLVYG